MSLKKITLVVGVRPNFIKIAPIVSNIRKVEKEGLDIHCRLVHTGQHYDSRMSASFFEELNIPQPDTNLGCHTGTQIQQTAAIMTSFEDELIAHPCDLVLVVGDVNSTLSCSIVAKKLGVKLAHVEAGIRSFDMQMPEEINRIITDSISDYLFTTSEYANKNLRNSGISDDKIFFVGNVMIDTLLSNINRLRPSMDYERIGLPPRKYMVLTLHRPANVDNEEKLKETISTIVELSNGIPIVFPVHPRTAKKINGNNNIAPNLYLIPPQGYLEFIYLVNNSLVVITDSGGITEETTVLHVPCLTLRDNTERPETCILGTNMLVGTNKRKIATAMDKIFLGNWGKGTIPPLWDGKAAERIVNILLKL